MWLRRLFKSKTLPRPEGFTDDESSRKALQLVNLICSELRRASELSKKPSTLSKMVP